MKRKTVQTKYDVPVRRAFRWASEQKFCEAELHEIFRIPAPWLTKEIIFVCTVFLSFTLRMTCERTLISALHTLRKHHRICDTTSIKLRLSRSFPAEELFQTTECNHNTKYHKKYGNNKLKSVYKKCCITTHEAADKCDRFLNQSSESNG